jgi:hypothetical protein
VNPLLRGGQEIMQSLSHVVAPGQQMYFYYEVYDPAVDAAGAPEAHLEPGVLSRPCEGVRDASRDTHDDRRRHRKASVFQLALPGSSLKPGLYTCQINVVDEISGKFAFHGSRCTCETSNTKVRRGNEGHVDKHLSKSTLQH